MNKRKRNTKKIIEAMNNNRAIKEIENLKAYYTNLMEEYIGKFNDKEFKKLADGLQIKIDALDLAIIALEHIEVITGAQV